jgi:hypothetical protein
MRNLVGATAFAALMLSGTVYAAEIAPKTIIPQSGGYDGELLIGYDPNARSMDGYYRSETGGGKFSCIFYFKGVIKGDSADIQSYFPESPNEKIGGVVKLSDAGEVTISLNEDHGGCWNVQHFADKEHPAKFTLSTEHPWKSIRIIKSEKAHFFDAPNAKTPRKGYVVKGDAVGVKSASQGWLDVDYTSGGKLISGWIKESELFVAQ